MAASYVVGDGRRRPYVGMGHPNLTGALEVGRNARHLGVRVAGDVQTRYHHERTVWASVQPAADAPWRLSVRGRRLLVALLVVLFAGVALTGVRLGSVAGAAAAIHPEVVAQGPAMQPVAERQIRVSHNDTLWQIAGRVYPQHDSRDAVVALRAANGIAPGQEIVAGQSLVLPQLE